MFPVGRMARSASTTRTPGCAIATVRVGPHTTDMVWREGSVEDHPEITARLFVSASNTNNVYVLGATESGDLSRLETINLSLDAAPAARHRRPAGWGSAPMARNSSSRVRMPMQRRLSISPARAAGCSDSCPPAGIPPLLSVCRTAAWAC